MTHGPEPQGFASPRVLVPFIIVTLIWSSTWLVIKDQLGVVPGIWSVSYRFTIASLAMFAYAAFTRRSLRIGREGHLLAIAFGVPQFMLNFNFVYAAEAHVTSGLVAVVFALLMVPNSVLAWLFLKQRVTGRFVAGSAIAMIGVALLFVQEIRGSAASTGEVLLGIALTLGGVLSASVSNVLQSTARIKARPMASLLAWGMLYGTAGNVVIALLTVGPPVFEYRIGYVAGLLYLGLAGSAIAFALYFGVIRAVGPGKAAYSSLLTPIIAMALSTAFEGYRWSVLAAAGGVLAMAGLYTALRSVRPAAPQSADATQGAGAGPLSGDGAPPR